MNKIFHLKDNGTTVRTEVLAGLTTFMTMAYILALNPNLLTGFAVGTPLWNAIFLATCIASGIGTLVMAFLANKPFAMSSGIGLNSFAALCATSIAAMVGVSYVEGYQAVMCIILIEGIVFLLLSIFNVRDKIVNGIPYTIRMAISPAIGLMLMNIGLGSNVGVYTADGSCYYVMRDFFGALTSSTIRASLGDSWAVMLLTVITMFVGLFLMIGLRHHKVRGNVLLGMLGASVFYWVGQAIFCHTNPFASLATASWLPPFGDLVSTTLFKFNFSVLAQVGWGTVITLIITFCIIDMFDTIGTVLGTATKANMVDAEGNVPQMKEILTSDAIGTIAGGITGTSTITTFIESASGVEAGGRTGLTAAITGLIFLACMFISPIAAIIPAAATSSALIYVGILMLQNLNKIDFNDIDSIIPASIMLIGMPISGSIGNSIGIALITYAIMKLIRGKGKNVPILTYIISIIFLVKFFIAI